MIGALAALASSFTWSAGSSVYARLSKDYLPSQVNFSRALTALPLFILSAVFFGEMESREVWTRLVSGNGFWLLMSMLGSYGLGDMAFFWSVRALGLPGALAIASSYPFWSAAAGVIFEGHSLSALKILGVVCTVLGTVVVVLVGYRHRNRIITDFFDRFEVGLALGFITSLFWALNTFAVSKGAQGLSPHVANSVRMIAALAICPVVGLVLQRKWRTGIPWQSFKPVSWVFALEAYGGSFFFVYGLAHSPLAVASALSSLSPVIAVPMAWMGKHEPVSWVKALGVCVAVLGAILLVIP
ncbi:MAG: DMT family transporter [Bdellovibrionales bacterium]|nr:DMT family transporter [Bdellovibrionales bacterium]